MTQYFGGVEAGGTKFICGIGKDDGNIIHNTSIPTGKPKDTIPLIIDFFLKHSKDLNLAGLTLGCFGPLDMRKGSPEYGHIKQTNKKEWINYPILEEVSKKLKIPTFIETDVNIAAVGEYLWGSGKGINNLLYLTVGTGIGGSLLIYGKPIPTFNHLEMGHISITPSNTAKNSKGACHFHDECLEGYASGHSLKTRWKLDSLTDLPDGHPLWEEESELLGKAILNYMYCFSPQKIILGGGVIEKEGLIKNIIKKVVLYNNNYILFPEKMDEFIVKASLNGKSALLGAISLAKESIKNEK
tara:strand:+ start:205 stop:1101 length:897 start_codon:yes stop_codon:yes gene_type:complete